MTEGEVISASEVRRYLTSRPDWEREEPVKSYDRMKLSQAKDEFEREFLLRKLRENQNNITRTSQALGITPSHLHNKIKKYGIEVRK